MSVKSAHCGGLTCEGSGMCSDGDQLTSILLHEEQVFFSQTYINTNTQAIPEAN